MLTTRARASQIAWSLAIVAAAAAAGIEVDGQPPGIGRYTRDWLVRARGPLPVPEEIAVVAIDEPSMARLGRFPWCRPPLPPRSPPHAETRGGKKNPRNEEDQRPRKRGWEEPRGPPGGPPRTGRQPARGI